MSETSKARFDVEVPFHAFRSKEKAYNDAGIKGRVIELIEISALRECEEKLKKAEELIGELNRKLKSINCTKDVLEMLEEIEKYKKGDK